ncbi:MAG: ATPase [Thermoprotei archaeon]|nr:MAG: ATPase [Thermoprotei archaeon]
MSKREVKVLKLLLALNIASIIILIAISAHAFTKASILREEVKANLTEVNTPLGITDASFYALSAAISVLGSTIASGIALRGVATAGLAAMAERPELRTIVILLGGLAEGIAIYGILMGILLIGRIPG